MRDKYEAEMRRLNKVSNANRPEGYHDVGCTERLGNNELCGSTPLISDGKCSVHRANKPQHTPTPWVSAPVLIHRLGLNSMDAAYIVKAVNCHEELVSALKHSHNMHHALLGKKCSGDCVAAEAIAKAEGK